MPPLGVDGGWSGNSSQPLLVTDLMMTSLLEGGGSQPSNVPPPRTQRLLVWQGPVSVVGNQSGNGPPPGRPVMVRLLCWLLAWQ